MRKILYFLIVLYHLKILETAYSNVFTSFSKFHVKGWS